MLKLFNTLTRKKEIFKPLRKNRAGLYTCGPTVYDFAHIGNLRTYVFEDILKRVLLYNSYKVKHIMNITDVGHLTSDADTGEDKLEKGAKREKKTVWEIADFYTLAFQNDLKRLNILEPNKWLKATATIKEQIHFIKVLEKKGFTYTIKDGVYFDTSKLKTYGCLWGAKKPPELKAGTRVKMVKGKKHLTDFALWKLTLKGVKRQMEWQSPWGVGCPGWHTECVVMSSQELGSPFDIHCGGVDHIPVHHTNEIGQSQAAFGNNLPNFWLHGEFLNLKGKKISKSLGNLITLNNLIKNGFNPLSLRYLFLTAHYRAKLDFTLESLQAAQNGLNKLFSTIQLVRRHTPTRLGAVRGQTSQFQAAINDDLNMPKALALLWQMLNDKKLSNSQKYTLALDFDQVFGLGLADIAVPKPEKIPPEIFQLLQKREKARQSQNWAQADLLRQKIKDLGYNVEDTPKGPKTKKDVSK